MRTHNIYLHVKENRKHISTLSPALALGLTLTSSNYPSLEHNFIVLKVFEPLKFDCMLICEQIPSYKHESHFE